MKPGVRRIVAAIAAVSAISTLPSLAAGAASASGKPAKEAASTKPAAKAPETPAANSEVGGRLLASRGIAVHYPARDALRLPAIPASAYVVADADTGQVLAAKDAHGLYPPASTLKVLTAIALLPRLNPNAMVKATRLAASVEPNIVGLIPGRSYKVADLFRALLLISANDAAVALTQATGSFRKGMALINAEAHHLQAYDVVAKVPNGLPATGQVVSAYDLALIARQALSMPAFMRYDSTLTAQFPITTRKRETLINQNYLLTQYKGGIGGKIGWTIKAEATYIGLARRHGVTLIATIMHCTPLQEIYSAEKLLDWGFAMAGHVQAVGTLVAPLPPTHSLTAAKLHRPGAAVAQGNSLAASTNGSQVVQIAVGAASAFVLCAGVTAFVMRRRRATPGKNAQG